MKLGKFKNTDFTTFIGVTAVRLKTNKEGVPIVNPTRAIMAKYLDNVTEDGDEIEYIKEAKLAFGYDKLGGVRVVNEEVAKELMEDHIVNKAVKLYTVRLLCEAEKAIEVIEKGEKLQKKVKFVFPLDFKFYNNQRVNKNNTTRQVFNTQGQSAWLDVENLTAKGETILKGDLSYFNVDSIDKLKDMPLGAGNRGFGELIDFIYSYAKVSKKDAELIDKEGVNLDEIYKGNFKSIAKVFKYIEANRTEGGVKLFGANVLFTGELNGTEARQDYYHVFSPAVQTDDGKLSKSYTYIANSILKDRKPVGGKTYSPESKGIIISSDFGGMPKYGLKELKQNTIDEFIKRTTGAVTNPGEPAGFSAADDEAFDEADF